MQELRSRVSSGGLTAATDAGRYEHALLGCRAGKEAEVINAELLTLYTTVLHRDARELLDSILEKVVACMLSNIRQLL
jgi:hypothetical protein